MAEERESQYDRKADCLHMYYWRDNYAGGEYLICDDLIDVPPWYLDPEAEERHKFCLIPYRLRRKPEDDTYINEYSRITTNEEVDKFCPVPYRYRRRPEDDIDIDEGSYITTDEEVDEVSPTPSFSSKTKENMPEGCYLTTACMQNQAENFDDKCYQLETLRWFRDKYVSKEDKAHYYKVAPTIVAEVDKHPMKNVFYSYIYTHLVDRCVHLIENKEYNLAYDVYKSSVQNFEKRFIHNENKNELEK